MRQSGVNNGSTLLDGEGRYYGFFKMMFFVVTAKAFYFKLGCSFFFVLDKPLVYIIKGILLLKCRNDLLCFYGHIYYVFSFYCLMFIVIKNLALVAS